MNTVNVKSPNHTPGLDPMRRLLRLVVILLACALTLSFIAVLAATAVVASNKGVSIFDVLPVTLTHLGEIFGLNLLFLFELVPGLMLALALEVVMHEGGHLLAGRA